MCLETEARLLAHQIKSDPHLHKESIIGLSARPKVFGSALKMPKNLNTILYKPSVEEKQAFKVVKRYVEAKESHAVAWKEV